MRIDRKSFFGENDGKQETNKRIQRSLQQKNFTFQDTVFALELGKGESAAEFGQRILAAVEQSKSHSRLRKWHIDDAAFINMAPYVNWTALTADGEGE